MSFILVNSETGRYFAGVTVSEGSHNCIVTSVHKGHAKVFSKKKDAESKVEFLKNSGYTFNIVKEDLK